MSSNSKHSTGLWSNSRFTRLTNARALSAAELQRIYAEYGRDSWPSGCATSINPLLVTLGPSPGNSPQPGDECPTPVRSIPMPTAGQPHCGVQYQDGAGYWEKVRYLAYEIVRPEGGSDADALSLFGNLNLDSNREGNASDVVVSVDFARWVLQTVRDSLRPRILVLMGLREKLKEPHLGMLFEETFSGFSLRRPHNVVPFRAYQKKSLKFREWSVIGPKGNELLIVMWPQHPSRSPFTNVEYWRASCEQFKERCASMIE